MCKEKFKLNKKAKYKRIILKISGEILRDQVNKEIIDSEALNNICKQIKEVHDIGIQIGLVIGGGNIFRGLEINRKKNINRATGDYMGMLATVINGMAIMESLERIGVSTRIQSAIPMNSIAEPFILRRAIRHMEKGRLVIFVAGTGNPYFSTDTTAALRANEIEAQVIFKATKVDGIYNKDPKKFVDAIKYKEISFLEALEKRIQVMDTTAFSLCLDNNMPIIVFKMHSKNTILDAIFGLKIGTLVH